jgi:hypothetical protein
MQDRASRESRGRVISETPSPSAARISRLMVWDFDAGTRNSPEKDFGVISAFTQNPALGLLF